MTYDDFKLKVAGRLKEIRNNRGMTQEEISGLDIHVRSYQKLEAGVNAISLKSVYVLAKRLGVHPSEFFDFEFP